MTIINSDNGVISVGSNNGGNVVKIKFTIFLILK